MKGEVITDKNKRRTLALSMGLFLFAIYLFSYRGGFHSVDEVSMFAVTESLVKFGRVHTDQIAWTQWTTTQAEAQGFFGLDGHVYSKKGLGLSLAQVPFYWPGLILPNVGMLQTVSLLNACITAVTGLILLMFVWRLNFSTATAVITTLIYGVATIVFIYAKYLFSEPLAGFLLLLAAYMLFTYRQEGGLRHVAIAGLAAGLTVLTRANNLFLLPVFGLYLLQGIGEPIPKKRAQAGQVWRIGKFAHSLIRPLAVFGLALAIPGVILMGYNATRSGNPLQTGYDLTLFSPNVLLGLYKLLFSPLRGLFIYSPILLLSLPGWWLLRRSQAAEAWLFAGLVGVTIGLFSAWSSGEGLSWGSRFLVPVVPFFVISLVPIIEQVAGGRVAGSRVAGSRVAGGKVASGRVAGGRVAGGKVTDEVPDALRNTQHTAKGTQATHNTPPRARKRHATRNTQYVLRFTFYVLLLASFVIQLLGITINPWVFLTRLQTDFGGEFFLENTAALYNFRYSQIVGQLQSWSLSNSDLAWWQSWGFDGLAFGLSLVLILFSGWLLWSRVAGEKMNNLASSPWLIYVAIPITILVTYILLVRYYQTDRQFGPPDDGYTRALNTILSQAAPNDQIVSVTQYHYHVPMNRFKAQMPIIGFAQQAWPPPETAMPLLKATTSGQNTWLVTIGFPPAAPDNATEQWLTLNTFKASDEWFDDVRLVRYTAERPTTSWPIDTTLGQEIQLIEVSLVDSLQAGQTLPVEFIWLSLRQPSTNYNLFLQLLTAEGALVAQHDNPPNGGYTPTSTWLPGQQIRDHHALVLPADLQPDHYRLIAGLYDPNTGERLPVTESGDFVELGNINVQR